MIQGQTQKHYITKTVLVKLTAQCGEEGGSFSDLGTFYAEFQGINS